MGAPFNSSMRSSGGFFTLLRPSIGLPNSGKNEVCIVALRRVRALVDQCSGSAAVTLTDIEMLDFVTAPQDLLVITGNDRADVVGKPGQCRTADGHALTITARTRNALGQMRHESSDDLYVGIVITVPVTEMTDRELRLKCIDLEHMKDDLHGHTVERSFARQAAAQFGLAHARQLCEIDIGQMTVMHDRFDQRHEGIVRCEVHRQARRAIVAS